MKKITNGARPARTNMARGLAGGLVTIAAAGMLSAAAMPALAGSAEAKEKQFAPRISEPAEQGGGKEAGQEKKGSGADEKTTAAAKAGFGKKIMEIPIGAEENQVGMIRTNGNKVPFGMFNGPSSFAVDAAGKLFVIDCLNKRVTVFDMKDGGNFVKSVSYFTDKDHRTLMADIAVTAAGAFYLADQKNKSVIKFSSLGLPESAVGAPEPPKFAGLKQPGEIAVDRKGNLFVRDFSEDSVYKFGPDGKFAGTARNAGALCFSSKNARPYYEFHEDSRSWKIYMESESGEIQNMVCEIPKNSPGQNIQIIGMDAADNIYIKSFNAGAITILKAGQDGKIAARYRGHNEPEFDTSRYFFVNPSSGAVYAARYNGSALEIDELEEMK